MALLLAVSLLVTLSQLPAGTTGTSLSGIVSEDGTEKPLAGAEVTLIKVDRPPMWPGPLLQNTAITDAAGRYKFENVEAGRYRVMVQKTGYAAFEGPDARGLVVEPGVARQSLNFSLPKGAVIVGRVIDETGEPIAGAQVLVFRKPPAHLAGRMSSSNLVLMPAGPMAQTNDLGEFRVFGLPAHDEYFVHASPRPRFGESATQSSTMLMPTYFPGALDSQAAQPIAVGAGQTSAEVVIRMVSAPSFQVIGVVVDEAGRPVPNALVRVLPEQKKEPMFMRGEMPAHTDSQGRFVLGNLTNGSYTILAIAPVVTSRSPVAVTGGANGGGSSFSSGMGIAGGSMGGGVTTETIDGVTTEYRDDAGTRVEITVNQSDVDRLEITVRRPPR
jgi:uncharacterized membrane protein YgcG